MRFRKAYILLLVIILLACKSSALNTVELSFANPDGSSSPEITAEVAATKKSIKHGLMYRRDLAPESGMLFIFSEEKRRSFWMKNTYLALDIIYINAEREVDSIVHNAIPHTETRRESAGPVRFALEVNAGQAKNWGVVPGSRLIVDSDVLD